MLTLSGIQKPLKLSCDSLTLGLSQEMDMMPVSCPHFFLGTCKTLVTVKTSKNTGLNKRGLTYFAHKHPEQVSSASG